MDLSHSTMEAISMQHLIREDKRGMLSVPEANWLQEQTVPAGSAIRETIARALLTLADRLAPAVAAGEQERQAAVRVV